MQVLFGTDTKVGLASQAKNYTQQECQVKQSVKDILFDTLVWILSTFYIMPDLVCMHGDEYLTEKSSKG